MARKEKSSKKVVVELIGKEMQENAEHIKEVVSLALCNQAGNDTKIKYEKFNYKTKVEQ